MKISPDLSQVSPIIAVEAGPKEMLSVLPQPDGRTKVRINYSSLDIIQTCPRKAYYLLERKLIAKNESPATLYGKAIHGALEVFYSHSRRERTMPKNFLEHAELIPAGVAPPEGHFLYAAISRFCEIAAPLRALPDSDKRSLGTGIWTLFHYFKTYLEDPYVVFCDSAGPVTERRFSLPLLSRGLLDIELFGTIDVVLKHEVTGVIIPTDHKTSSVVGADFYSRLKPNAQYTGYLLGAQAVLGLDTDSFMVNAIQVKPRPVTARGMPPHFPRQITKRSPDDMQEFREQVYASVVSFLQWKETGIFPLGPVNSCASYGGCNFLEICSAPTLLRNAMIENKFAGWSDGQ